MVTTLSQSPATDDQSPQASVGVGQGAVPFLTASGVRRTYQVGDQPIEVLRGIDLTVQQGERIFLCGPSGAGKTTLLYVLGGLERPDGGEVKLEGKSVYGRSDAQQAILRNSTIGYIFQNYLLKYFLST